MNKIKVAMLSSYSSRGGAAKATNRIFEGLKNKGYIDPVLIHFDNAPKSYLIKWINRLTIMFNRFFLKNRISYLSYNLFGLNERKLLNRLKDFDVICLFWINDSFLSLKTISKILSLDKPVLWRLSDMWPFTGGCHYSDGCHQYVLDCRNCPYFTNPELIQLTNKILAFKIDHWNTKNLNIICPSYWILNLSKSSQVFKNAQHSYLPTGAETEVYFPLNKLEVRRKLGLIENKFIIGVGADNLEDKRKGLDLFFLALSIILVKYPELMSKMHIVSVGTISSNSHPYNITSFGHVNESKKLNDLYNSFDVFVAPSREENLANTVLEAMSAGVPCLTFDVGGMKDVICPDENGYLVKPFDVMGLAEAIVDAFKSKEKLSVMGKNARKKILNEFSLQLSVDRFADKISSTLNEFNGK